MLTFLTTDSLPWPVVYFIGMLIANALVWLSRDTTLKGLGFILFMAWVSENVMHNQIGGMAAAPWIAAADLALLTLVLAVGYEKKSWTAYGVAVLFALDQAILWGAVADRHPEPGLLYAVLNGMYFLQLSIVGGAGARMAIALLRLQWVPRSRLAPHR